LAGGGFAKYHLVPFGEFVPLEDWLRGLIEFFNLPMSGLKKGQWQQSNITLSLPRADEVASASQNEVQIAIGICYEIAYGNSMRQRAEEAGVLLTISNDTWFGGSIGPHQHMQIARMRALENGRWLLRGTNNGVTAVVNAKGKMVDQLPQFEPAVLRGEFAVMQGRTPYSRIGDWPILALMFGALGIGILSKRRSPA
jgi:apolipoprotein N-acyltransferase